VGLPLGSAITEYVTGTSALTCTTVGRYFHAFSPDHTSAILGAYIVNRERPVVNRNVTHRLCTGCTLPRLQGMPLDIRIRFGRAIRRVREEQKINQEEAAERCGLHRTYYSGVERGVRNVSLVNLEKISKGLRVSLSQLFSRL
jgi:DNA-binding XRE family transcriptional regulator